MGSASSPMIAWFAKIGQARKLAKALRLAHALRSFGNDIDFIAVAAARYYDRKGPTAGLRMAVIGLMDLSINCN